VSAVSTHVLDTATGRPAAGVPVRLELAAAGGPSEIGRAVTDGDGRVGELGPARLEPGRYRLVFDTGRYLDGLPDDQRGGPSFYPEVVVVFTADGQTAHYHLPLLLSPFGYTTYRGS
jgi:5-hydroxyisourate hydrolase